MQRRGRSISMGNETKRGDQLGSVTYVVSFPLGRFVLSFSYGIPFFRQSSVVFSGAGAVIMVVSLLRL
jgi:hypothetical protein